VPDFVHQMHETGQKGRIPGGETVLEAVQSVACVHLKHATPDLAHETYITGPRTTATGSGTTPAEPYAMCRAGDIVSLVSMGSRVTKSLSP
jgi:hypothetical protein